MIRGKILFIGLGNTPRALKEILQKGGYDVEAVTRTEFKVYQKHDYELIIIDDNESHGTVYDVIALADEIRNVPVLVATHRDILERKMLASRKVIVGVLEFPNDESILINTINDILQKEVEIRFWGVRGSIPCPDPENMIYGGNTSCVQINLKKNNEYLILDSGSGIRTLGNSIVNEGREVHGHIFITHAHWDHIQGFPFFKPIYSQENSLSIHMPRQLVGDCKTVLNTQFTPTYFPVTVEMLNAHIDYVTQEPELQSYNKYSVEFMLGNHPVDTALYKIRTHNTVIVYAPDNELIPRSIEPSSAFRERLSAFIQGADVLIHDANYDRAGYPEKKGWGHTAWEEITELASECGVKNLYLTHHDPLANDVILKKREELVKQYASDFHSLQLAREGLIIHI